MVNVCDKKELYDINRARNMKNFLLTNKIKYLYIFSLKKIEKERNSITNFKEKQMIPL